MQKSEVERLKAILEIPLTEVSDSGKALRGLQVTQKNQPPGVPGSVAKVRKYGSKPAALQSENTWGTSLTRNSNPLGPYSRTMPRALWWP